MSRQIVEDLNSVAFCGLYCGACKSFLNEKCDGCRKNEKATWCKIRICCMNKKISSCAECLEYPDPMACSMFNNIFSKFFAFLFKSNRAACISLIKNKGLQEYAKKMTNLRKHTLKNLEE
ncbi:MAG: DUF3795 domain-containing protein [Candidatus Riflebacteria bacterium]|nr:DUF3795 domain-containing protein [Candidatus Riflebacteria bacterium]